MSSAAASSNNKTSAPLPSHLLVSAALETLCHQLLYVRRVYPSSSFCDSYFLGIRYKANRHPGVVEYIQNAVQVAVPALIGNHRVANEFCFEVVEDHTWNARQNLDGDDNHHQDSEEERAADKDIKGGRNKREREGGNEEDSDDDEDSEDDVPIDLPIQHDDPPPKEATESDSEQPDSSFRSIAKKLQLSSTPSNSQDSSSSQPSSKKKQKLNQDGVACSSYAKATRSSQDQPNNTNDLNQTQQSVSSLSQQQQDNQSEKDDDDDGDDEEEEHETDLKLSASQEPASNHASQSAISSDINSLLEYKSLKVLERFTLYFSLPPAPSTEEEEQQQSATFIIDLEDMGTTTKKKPPPKKTLSFRSSGRFRPSQKKPTPKPQDPFQGVLPDLERAFRNLLLHLSSSSSLKRDRILSPSDTLSFKLLLRLQGRQRRSVSVCPEIRRAFEVGSWYPASSETERLEEEQRPHLPLYQVGVGADLLNLQFHMQRQPEEPGI